MDDSFFRFTNLFKHNTNRFDFLEPLGNVLSDANLL
jgi:hypothetical protein